MSCKREGIPSSFMVHHLSYIIFIALVYAGLIQPCILVCCLATGWSLGLSPRDHPARRDNTLGSWCQQHTPIHD